MKLTKTMFGVCVTENITGRFYLISMICRMMQTAQQH